MQLVPRPPDPPTTIIMAARFPITNYSLSVGDVNSLQGSPPAWLLIGHNNSFIFWNKKKSAVMSWAAHKNRPSSFWQRITVERLLTADPSHYWLAEGTIDRQFVGKVALVVTSHLLDSSFDSSGKKKSRPGSSYSEKYGKKLWWDTIFFPKENLALNQKCFWVTLRATCENPSAVEMQRGRRLHSAISAWQREVAFSWRGFLD